MCKQDKMLVEISIFGATESVYYILKKKIENLLRDTLILKQDIELLRKVYEVR